ncbi:M16 family metallopeptidase [Desulfomarina sp.]
MRYVIKENHEPEKRVALYLDVQAGSLNENPDQRGVAHFLEHMMFNGSIHFPPGSLVEYFQEIGMNYGGDANAHTGYSETVYNLVLPDGRIQDLEKGLLVLADYARGALLPEKEIDRERGVILAEKRARDSAIYRTHIASTSFAFRGTRIPLRTIIGREEILKTADRAVLKSYYDSWYRPENMVLVVVGDIDPGKVQKSIKKHFSSLSAAGKKPACPDFGRLQHRGKEFFYYYEPELAKTNVSIESLWDKSPHDDSVALETREIKRFIAAMIIRYRLQKILEKPGTPYTGAGFYYGDLERRIGYGSISAQTDGAHWQETLKLLNNILRQALRFGFYEHELERARKEILAGFDAAVLQEKNEDSRFIARKIIRHINSNRVLQSAEQERDLFGPIIKQISLTDIHQEFRKIWNHDSRLVSVTGDVQLENGKKDIQAVYQDSLRETITAFENKKKGEFPYLKTPESITPPRQVFNSPELGVEVIRFANGTVLNLKKTDFRKNEIQMTVSFGTGELEEPQPGMSMIAEDVINESGTGKFSKSELNEILAGSTVEIGFSIQESSFLWRGNSLTKDFDVLLQSIYSHIFDITVRKTVFDSEVIDIAQMYKKLEQDVDGAVPLKILPFLATGNAHFGLPPVKSVLKIDFSQLSAWVKTLVPENDLEISVVGDFDRKKIIEGIQEYFSGLKLYPRIIPEIETISFPKGKTKEVRVQTSIGKSVILVAWLTEDFWDINRTRKFHLLASVIEDRLRKVLREKMGATYSPEAFSDNSRTYRDYGFLAVHVTMKPGSEEMIKKEIFRIAGELRKNGVTDEELERARKPLLTSIRESLENNSYWLYSVLLRSSIHPEQLDWPLTIEDEYSKIKKEELDRLIQKYLIEGRAAVAVARPAEK